MSDDSQAPPLEEARHGRMTKVVAFNVAITDSAIRDLLESEDGMVDTSAPLPISAVEEPVADVIREELSHTPYAVYSADVGRGASGYGAALEIVHYIAEFGGAAIAIAEAIKVTRRVYEKLRLRLGHRPSVSLGAACFLAAGDLYDRLGDGNFVLHGAGDTRGRPIDSSYTGLDCFYVIFERDAELFIYVVDADGDAKFLGNARLPRPY